MQDGDDMEQGDEEPESLASCLVLNLLEPALETDEGADAADAQDLPLTDRWR